MAEGAEAGELRRFLVEGHPLRGHWVHLGAAWQELRARRAYPPIVESLLGEAAAAAVLLAATLKFAGTLTMQFAGSGRVRLLVAQCTDDFRLRAIAHHDLADGEPASFEELVGSGNLVVTVQSDTSTANYQGIVPLDGGSLAEAAQGFFVQSEQIPSLVRLAAGESGHVAGGLLLQHLPEGEEGRERIHARQSHAEWDHVRIVAETIRPAELTDPALPLEELLWRLFHDEDEVRLLPGVPLVRGCRCDAAHVRAVLARFALEERAEMADGEGFISVDCEFCSRVFPIKLSDLET